MNKEIAFQPVVLLAGVLGAVAGGVWGFMQPYDGSMEPWAMVAGFGFLGFCAFIIPALYLVEPYARFKHAVLGEGLPRKSSLQVMFIEYGVMAFGAAAVLTWHDAIREADLSFKAWLHAHPTISLAFLIWGVIAVTFGVAIIGERRRERNKLKTIDLSKSRDLTLK